MNGVEDYFEKHAKDWVEDAYRQDNGPMSIGLQRIALVRELVDRHFSGQSIDVCDFGCGGGNLCHTLADLGHRVTGVDRSAGMLEISTSQDAENRVEFISSDIDQADSVLRDKKFDLATCIGALYYLPDDKVFFEVARNLLKPKGRLIITCRNRLFNLFPGSEKMLEEAKNPDLPDLLEELASLNVPMRSSDLAAGLELLHQCSSSECLSALPVVNQTKQMSAHEEAANIVEGRQHTPSQISSSAELGGFTVEKCYGVQPHFILAGNSDVKTRQQLKKLSEALLPLSAQPQSLIWSSHFMVDMVMQ